MRMRYIDMHVRMSPYPTTSIQGFGRSPSAQARAVWQAPCPAGRQGGRGAEGQRGPVVVVPANYLFIRAGFGSLNQVFFPPNTRPTEDLRQTLAELREPGGCERR